MKKIVTNLAFTLFLSLIAVVAMAQPNWYYSITGSNHSIIFPTPANITIDGVAVGTNDYVGVFYDSLGTLACAGYIQVSATSFAITAWGAEAGFDNGFQPGEIFTWKIWRASDGLEFFTNAAYLPPNPFMLNTNAFAGNGMSGVSSLAGLIGSDLAIGNLLSPISGCGLSSAEYIKFKVNNVGSVGVDTLIVSFSVDSGLTYTIDTIIQNLPTNGNYIYTSAQTFDFSGLGIYPLEISVSHPLDFATGNNSQSYTIYNSTPPVIDLSAIALSYCQSSQSVPLTGIPAGGDFSSNGLVILNNQAHFTTQGTFSILYNFTDSTGCAVEDSIAVAVNPVPNINLGPDLFLCEGDVHALSVPSGFASYAWSTGSTNASIAVAQGGTYSVTVTNSFNCVRVDTLTATYHPLPVVSISGDTVACQGDAVSLSVAGQGTSYSWSNGLVDDVISVNSSGLYVVTVSSFNCDGYDSIQVTFLPNPDPNLGPDMAFCNGNSVSLDAGIYAGYVWSDGSTNQTLDVSAAGTYSVTVTSTEGCVGNDAILLTIQPDPVVNLGADMSICDGDSYNLNAGMFSSYIWNDGSTGQILAVSAAGTYAVTVTDNIGCTGGDEIEIGVTLLAQALFSLVKNGMEVTFTNESQNEDPGYLWKFGDGNTATDENPVHTYALNGTYNVTLYVGNSCGNDSIMRPVNVVGIDDLERAGLVSIFPNPSNGFINVELNYKATGEVKLSVFNLLGQEVFFTKESKGTYTLSKNIDLSEQAPGLYFLKIESGKLEYNKKIVIK